MPPVDAVPSAQAVRRPGPTRWSRVVRSVLGWVAVVALLGGAAVSLVPIDNPGVQVCGAPAFFLLDGRIDTYPDQNRQVRRSDGSVDTLTDAEIDRAFDSPCTDRVADRMVPVAYSMAIGIGLGLVALIASLISWWRHAPPRPPRIDPTTPLPATDAAAEHPPN